MIAGAGPGYNAAKLSRCRESVELDCGRAGVGDADVGGAFDPVGVVAGAFDLTSAKLVRKSAAAVDCFDGLAELVG
jgi:hypothetical protein